MPPESARRPVRSPRTALIAMAVAKGTDGELARAADAVARLSLLMWGYQEIFSGSWLRRGLGFGGVALVVKSWLDELAAASGSD